MKKLILYILSGLLLFAGCTTTTEGFEQAEVLIVSHDTIEAESSEEYVTIKVNSLAPYDVKSSEKWITPSKNSGARGNSEFKLVIAKNETVNKRNATITVQNKIYGLSHDIVVTQKAGKPNISISTSSMETSAEAGNKAITITSNISWTASCDADWVTLSQKKGEKGETALTVTVKANAATVDRSATVKISNSEYNKTATINIKQQGYHVILYTSSNGSVVTPRRSTNFGANIVSNTYANGQGRILFDRPVTEIGYEAFSDCTSLTSITIPDGVTSIGNGAFLRCTSLASVTIPDSVTEIGIHAFFLSTSLTGITIPDSVTWIGYGAFYKCTSLTSITIPDSVTSIGSHTFADCDSLTSITIPDSVTSIAEGAFSGCDSLKAFYGKFASSDNRYLIVDGVLHSFAPGGLTEYTIPDSVTKIGSSAFENCTSLTSVTIPDSVTSIGSKAFYDCIRLKSVYCKPTTPPARGLDVFSFYHTTGLTLQLNCKIYVPRNSVEAYKAASYWKDYPSYIEGYDF